MSYSELCITSNFSFLEGASHPEEYVERAAKFGLKSIAIVDKNSISGVVRGLRAIKEIECDTKNKCSSLKLIPGVTIVTTHRTEITCLAQTRQGWGNICNVLTIGKKNSKKGYSLIDYESILKKQDGIIFLAHISEKNHSFSERLEWLRLIQMLKRNNSRSVYVVMAPRYDGLDEIRFHKINKFAKNFKCGVLASSTPLMHHGSRRKVRDTLSAIKMKCTIDDLGVESSINGEQRLRSTHDFMTIFKDYPEAVQNTNFVSDRCSFSLDELSYTYPKEVLKGENPDTILHELTFNGLNEYYEKNIPVKILKGVKKELLLIKKLKYAPYFLTVYDIVKFARSRGILCQGRGSAANSIVCFSLGVTSVSPEIGSMVFERFISEARNEPPDIDIDFEHERRQEIIDEIYRKYGDRRAALCATVIHYRAKGAIRDVGKVMGLSKEIISSMAENIIGWDRHKIPRYNNSKLEGKNEHTRILETLALSDQLIGFPRHLGQHVGGFIITEDYLDDITSIENTAMEGRSIIAWDKDDIDFLGILKIDILALGMLTCIKKSFDLIKNHHKRKVSLNNIPHRDTHVFNMLSKADTIGVFQVESRAQMNFLPRLKPQCFYDLVIQVAIVRPGPIQGDMVHPYIKRRNGQEKVTFPSEKLKEILGKTLGVPLFQEQAIQIAMKGAGFSLKDTDRLRRSLATFKRNGTVNKFKKRFIDGMLKNGYDKDFATKCFSQISGFGEYGFPESHAASFAILVYASAWIKYHYPDVFACALLNSQPMGFYSASQIIRDAKNHGVKVREICINKSEWDHSLENNGESYLSLRLGFRQIKGLSKNDVDRIIKERGNGYNDPQDLWHRIRLSPSIIKLLIKANCFHSLNKNRRILLWDAQAIKKTNSLALFEGYSEKEYLPEKTVNLPNMTLGEELILDYQSLQLSLSTHPVKLLRPFLKQSFIEEYCSRSV